MKRIVFILMIILIGFIGINSVKADENYGLWVNGEEFTSEKTTIDCGEGTATYIPSTNTLTLNNATISKDEYHGINYSKLETLTIILNGENTISSTRYGVYSRYNIIVQGTGSLIINADDLGIEAYDGEGEWHNVIIKSGEITISSENLLDCEKLVLDDYEGKIMQGRYLDGTNADVVSKERVLKWPEDLQTCTECDFKYLKLGNFETYPIENIATPKNYILSTPSEAFSGEKIRIEGGMEDANYVRLYIMNNAQVLNEFDEDISEELNYDSNTKEFIMPNHKVVINASFTKNFKLVPKTFKAELYGYKSIKLSWDFVPGIRNYQVYYKKGTEKNYTLLSNLNYKDALKRILTAGTKYTFKIVPVGTIKENKVLSDSYKTITIYTLKKMNIPTVKKYNSKKVQVKWTKVNGATKYQIARSLYKNKNYSIVKTVGSGYIGFKLNTKANKTYYYKVRACNGNICAPWSNYKSFKLK
ncbi:MAG: fibronectin type III domain-containing protein [Bacilli bacterium]|nr:fibronectin type III domain-containing protein [Bacilli bacterium]